MLAGEHFDKEVKFIKNIQTIARGYTPSTWKYV